MRSEISPHVGVPRTGPTEHDPGDTQFLNPSLSLARTDPALPALFGRAVERGPDAVGVVGLVAGVAADLAGLVVRLPTVLAHSTGGALPAGADACRPRGVSSVYTQTIHYRHSYFGTGP